MTSAAPAREQRTGFALRLHPKPLLAANGMPLIELRLRAYPVVHIDGQAAPLALKRGLALLALLAELGRKVARSQLGELLWPDAAADIGRARLRRLVHETNQALGIDAIVGDGDALWLAGEAAAVVSDVERTRRLARQLVSAPADAQSREALEELLQIDAHQVLEGFEFGAADTFDAWLAQRRSEQHRLVARALQRAGEQLIDSGQPLLAAEAAARLVAIEPLADAGHALLLRAHAQRGDLAAMESAYLSFAELLRGELGVRPSPAYEALYEQARRHVMQAAPSSSTEVAAAPGAPPIRFADTDDGAVAYLELGSGPQTLVILFGMWSHIEIAWDEPTIRAVLQRLAQRFRVVLMDRRGVGLSERLALEQSVPAGVEDIDAVRRAVGASQVWLFGNAAGGMIAIEYAALHEQAVQGLVLYAAQARGAWAPDYPWALKTAQLDTWVERLRSGWGDATSLREFAPSQANDPVARDWWARLMRQAMSRNSLPVLLREFGRMDVRHRLPQLRVPTLVLQREGDRIVRTGAARYLAEHITGARLKLLPGEDHNMWAGDVAAVIDEVERFVQARRE
jgi:pimeloyl-ACP methyl ester carboxylesterase/DNA-binding SARP family transcriptional activator